MGVFPDLTLPAINEESYSGECASTDTSAPSVLYGYLQRLGISFEMDEVTCVLEKTLKISTQTCIVLPDRAVFGMSCILFIFYRIFID